MSTRGYPKVWSRFERIVEDGRMIKFEIEDIPEIMWSTAVEFMLGHYIREDVWWKSAGEYSLNNIFISVTFKSFFLQYTSEVGSNPIFVFR